MLPGKRRRLSLYYSQQDTDRPPRIPVQFAVQLLANIVRVVQWSARNKHRGSSVCPVKSGERGIGVEKKCWLRYQFLYNW